MDKFTPEDAKAVVPQFAADFIQPAIDALADEYNKWAEDHPPPSVPVILASTGQITLLVEGDEDENWEYTSLYRIVRDFVNYGAETNDEIFQLVRKLQRCVDCCLAAVQRDQDVS